ncbi:MAG TPA: sigma-70 family RNA polymerase sigma factor [Acetobacteraceae bacterium]|nr:sigma-70 family RNA polymerase sigma factor [Acetobacteraceae bacterium]
MNGQGTDTALRAALAELLPELRAFARFLAGTKAEADDLVQEALARTLQSLDNAVEIGELRPWCFAVVRNVFHEHLRSRRREEARLRREVTVDAAPATQEMSADVRDLATQLRALSPLLREALILVGAQGLSYEEAARICGVPPGTVKARVSRARYQLSKALERVIE